MSGTISKIPKHLIIKWKIDNNQNSLKKAVEISETLPWCIRTRLYLMPWKYDVKFIVSIISIDEFKISWFLIDRKSERKSTECGGWLVNKFEENLLSRNPSISSFTEGKRQEFLCTALVYVNLERTLLKHN
ncbi:hypothetical protein PVT68_00600 [Microbulbifer bruguierae]|uniref:Coenzyme Q-binding protein COQ10 START domain-containing protein n=1 Tax=Microbulbifer bruguierae TaxID=3029061 RepID=A0ABY8ND12_9GAMM|nr:hypothetical protein [Microbulbifer bruguierae]WGL16814.1 hypothetical protein PVT68_00600 [Microbulbifer bruguierae]